MTNKKSNFSTINPLEKLANKQKEVTQVPDQPEVVVAPEEPPKKEVKKKPEYLRLDVTNVKEYVSLMAEHQTSSTGKYTSMTQYILQLIEADKEKNQELYSKLMQIEELKKDLI